MKKVISVFLCVLLLTSCVAFSASAISEKQGLDALNAQFISDRDNMDYMYFSPVTKSSDKNKYPLFIWLHGQFSGVYEGNQLSSCDTGLWASDEYQKRIKNAGGAYVLLPRDPLFQPDLAWNGEMNDLKITIDRFVAKHKKNIDTSRIYIGGYSMGGKAAIKIAALYPEYFAGIFPMSPVYAPTSAEINALKNTPIWLFSCFMDGMISHVSINSTWNSLVKVSSDKSKMRWSVFYSPLVNPDGLIPIDVIYAVQHNSWDAVSHDLFMTNNSTYGNMVTRDGNGKSITLKYPDGFLSWMSQHSLGNNEEEVKPDPKPEPEPKPEPKPEKPKLPNPTSALEALERLVILFQTLLSILFGQK